MNSAVHSYLILAYADNDKVAMNVGFYYMANAGGRLAGTVLSGLLYQWQGLTACLWASVAFVLAAGPALAHAPQPPTAIHRLFTGFSKAPRTFDLVPIAQSDLAFRSQHPIRVVAVGRAPEGDRGGRVRLGSDPLPPGLGAGQPA